MITTRWHQVDPWNQCVPFAKNYTARCAAGCVPVAVAQMLYFLNQKWGVPATMFTQGSCVGYSNGSGDKNYSFDFGSPSTSAWNNIGKDGRASTNSKYQSAILIGYMGYLLGANYSANGTGVDPGKMRSVFSDLGISSTYSDFNTNTVLNSLFNEMPVIVRADGSKDSYLFGLFSKYTDGHSWIIDGYKKTTRTVKTKYRWISTGGDISHEVDENGNIIGGMEQVVVSVSDSYLFRMNWGWKDDSYHTNYYSVGGDWIIEEGNETYNFKYRRKMLHNFSR